MSRLSSRHASVSSAGGSTIVSSTASHNDELPEHVLNCLVTYLGEEGADYFIHPPPKERVAIDSTLYNIGNDAYDIHAYLRDKSNKKLQAPKSQGGYKGGMPF